MALNQAVYALDAGEGRQTSGHQKQAIDRIGPYQVEDLAVMPGAPNTLAAARGGYSDYRSAIALFDAGIQRPDTFDNQIVDTDQQLIVVGNAATNVLVRHFNQQGSYAYDKVLDKITASYPDPGRGIVGTVESINCPYHDVTSKSRDAITVGGADPAGTAAAVKEFVGLLGKYAK